MTGPSDTTTDDSAAAADRKVRATFQVLARLARQWAEPGGASTANERSHLADVSPISPVSSVSTSARVDGPAKAPLPRQWVAIERTMGSQVGRARRRRIVGATGLGLAALASLLILRVWSRPAETLSFVVSDGRGAMDATVQPAGSAGHVSFSDGSALILQPGGRGRIVGTTRRGARVRLEQGRARFDVAHRAETDWLVDAGPFSIVVHGTVFDVSWSAKTGALEVDLIAGSVVVKGPLPAAGATLTAGQRLTAQAAPGRAYAALIGSVTSPPVARVTPTVVHLPVPDPSEAGTTAINGERGDNAAGTAAPDARRGSDGTRGPRRSGVSSADVWTMWPSRVAAGLFQSVVADADRYGVERCLAHASAPSLAALADAARYARRSELARRALVAQRRRFASTLGAHDAAFLIGRLAEDVDGDRREALRWYDRYLKEGDKGTYASEALGRKMLVLQKLDLMEDARAAAETYLRTFEGGGFTAQARQIRAQAH